MAGAASASVPGSAAVCSVGIASAQVALSAPRRKLRITRRAQRMPSTRYVSPSEVTWTVLRSVTSWTFAPTSGAYSGASANGVSESRSPPTISTGTDAGSFAVRHRRRAAERGRPVGQTS